jgi:HipA-like protein
MAEDQLAVYLDGVRVGILHQNAHGKLSFEYDDSYRSLPVSVPLSLSMPKAAKTHPNKRVLAFISGLPIVSPRSSGWAASTACPRTTRSLCWVTSGGTRRAPYRSCR